MKLDSFAPASPPDVRRGYASPSNSKLRMGLGPWFGLCPNVFMGHRPNQGLSPNLSEPERRGIASPHIGRRSRSEESSHMIGLIFKTVSHIRRRSRNYPPLRRRFVQSRLELPSALTTWSKTQLPASAVRAGTAHILFQDM